MRNSCDMRVIWQLCDRLNMWNLNYCGSCLYCFEHGPHAFLLTRVSVQRSSNHGLEVVKGWLSEVLTDGKYNSAFRLNEKHLTQHQHQLSERGSSKLRQHLGFVVIIWMQKKYKKGSDLLCVLLLSEIPCDSTTLLRYGWENVLEPCLSFLAFQHSSSTSLSLRPSLPFSLLKFVLSGSVVPLYLAASCVQSTAQPGRLRVGLLWEQTLNCLPL